MQLKAKVGLNYKQNTIFNWFLFFPFELSFHFLLDFEKRKTKPSYKIVMSKLLVFYEFIWYII